MPHTSLLCAARQRSTAKLRHVPMFINSELKSSSCEASAWAAEVHERLAERCRAAMGLCMWHTLSHTQPVGAMSPHCRGAAGMPQHKCTPAARLD